MKLSFKNTALAAIMLTGAFFTLNGQVSVKIKPAEISSPEQVASIKAELDSLELLQNFLIFSRFINDRENSSHPIPIFGLKTYTPSALFDTVPAIKALRKVYLDADGAYEQLLKRDSTYSALSDVVMKSKNRAEMEDAAFVLGNYEASKMKEMPELIEASNKRQVALSRQNAAMTRFILDHYQSQNRILPMEGLISENEIEAITNSNREISDVAQKIAILEFSLLSEEIEIELDCD